MDTALRRCEAITLSGNRCRMLAMTSIDPTTDEPHRFCRAHFKISLGIKATPSIKAQFSDEEAVEAILECRGNVRQAARFLGIGRDALWARIQDSDGLMTILEGARLEDLEWTASKLDERIEKGDTIATIFKLKCLGKEQGWVDTPQKTTIDVNHNVQMVDPHTLTLEQKQAILGIKAAPETVLVEDEILEGEFVEVESP